MSSFVYFGTVFHAIDQPSALSRVGGNNSLVLQHARGLVTDGNVRLESQNDCGCNSSGMYTSKSIDESFAGGATVGVSKEGLGQDCRKMTGVPQIALFCLQQRRGRVACPRCN